jgi:hypothetical protein
MLPVIRHECSKENRNPNEEGTMLGLHPSVGLAYILCLLSALLCVVYGLINWNKGDHSIDDEDKHWAEEEDKLEGEL